MSVMQQRIDEKMAKAEIPNPKSPEQTSLVQKQATTEVHPAEASAPSPIVHEVKADPVVFSHPEKHVLSPSGQEVPASLSALIGFESPQESQSPYEFQQVQPGYQYPQSPSPYGPMP